MLHVGTGFAHAGGGLLGDTRHEVQVEALAVGVRQRVDDGVFQLAHGVMALAERLAHVVVMAFRGNFHRPALQVLVQHGVEIVAARRRAEELEPDGVLHLTAQAFDEFLRVLRAGLQEVVQHEDGPPYMLLHVLDVADEQLRVAPGHAPAAEVVFERVGAAATGGAVARAAAAGEACGYGVAQPALHGQVAGHVVVAQHALHGVVVVKRDGVHVVGHPRKRVDVHGAAGILPGQVGDVRQIAQGRVRALGPRDALHQHAHGLLGGIAAEDVVDAVVGDQVLVEDGGGKAAEAHRRVRVQLLQDLRHLDGAMAVRHPVQVDAEHARLQARQVLLHVEVLLVQHHRCQVVDARAQPVALQVLAQGGEAERVHLEDGRGGHHVGNGAVHDGALAEVIRCGRVDVCHVHDLHGRWAVLCGRAGFVQRGKRCPPLSHSFCAPQ